MTKRTEQMIEELHRMRAVRLKRSLLATSEKTVNKGREEIERRERRYRQINVRFKAYRNRLSSMGVRDFFL